MVVTKKKLKYRVVLHEDFDLNATGMEAYYSKKIVLFTSDGWKIDVRFYETIEKGGDLGDNNTQLEMKEAWVFRRNGDFIPFLDILRNEKPLFWVADNDNTLAKGSLITDVEAVGEEEFKPFKGPIRPRRGK